jgi:YhcH/YjgK/YiaL family protein
MIIARLEDWRKYGIGGRLHRAFELLCSPEVLALPAGRHELDGERIIALPQGYATKEPSAGRWEAHRRYIDIQYMVSGREAMGWTPAANLVVDTDYDQEKDIAFYTGQGPVLSVDQGMFAVFFPHDGHMPGLRVSQQPEQVRKIVMKVLVDE